MTKIISRQDAIANGYKRYFTGKPCINGHLEDRYVGNKTCVVCADVNASKAKAKNPKKYIDNAKAWAKRNPEKIYQIHKAKRLANPGQRNAWTANYRSAKAERMPNWLNDGHLLEIESVYKYCAALRAIGLDYHVDHEVPLRGDSVSGLHVPWNMQVLPGRENMSKGNKHYV